MFKFFEIREGKFKVLPQLHPKYVKGFIIISIITILITGIADHFSIDQKNLWKIYSAVIEKLGLKDDIPEPLDTEKKIEAVVELEIDRSIEKYNHLIGDGEIVRIPPPRYSEKPIDNSVCYTDECRALGGEMRLCAPWVDDCPKQ